MAHIRNGVYPYAGWKKDFPPTTLFPFPKDGIDFPDEEIWWVHETPEPEYDPETQYVEEGEPEYVDERWQQTWEIKEIPPESEPPVPVEVEGWQAEVAMRATPVPTDLEVTVWGRVQELIAAMSEGIEKITAQTVLKRGKIRRDSPMLAQLAPLVPLTDEQVDDLMRLAASIEA